PAMVVSNMCDSLDRSHNSACCHALKSAYTSATGPAVGPRRATHTHTDEENARLDRKVVGFARGL
ncbi:MAG: hypothetical protein ACO305_18890, partial [Rubrivivax sp.]